MSLEAASLLGGECVMLSLPPEAPDKIASVVCLELAGKTASVALRK